MAEWWTYRPSDFLMFSAASHARLMEAYNRELWPLHLVSSVAALALLVALGRPASAGARTAGTLGLAAAWAWVGWGFLWSRFAEINTMATYLAAAAALQALLLTALAVLPGATAVRKVTTAGRALVLAAFGWPVFTALTGRSLLQAEYFGLALEPTALATLGWLLGMPVCGRAAAAVIPLVAGVVGAGTLWLLYGPA